MIWVQSQEQVVYICDKSIVLNSSNQVPIGSNVNQF